MEIKVGRAGKRHLLHRSSEPNYAYSEIDATPDVVVEMDEGGTTKTIIVEVKYKSIKNIVERSDLNQTIAYAASYGASHAILAVPALSSASEGLRALGVVGATHIFQYAMDLNATDIKVQEDALCQCIFDLLTG